MKSVEEINAEGKSVVAREITERDEPLILRGLVKHWPLVKESRQPSCLRKRLVDHYTGKPVVVYRCSEEAQGRVFYNETFTGFNFESGYVDFRQLLDKLAEYAETSSSPTLYVGSTRIDEFFPGLREQNDIEIEGANPWVNLWLGNQSKVAAHFDSPDNLACVVAGRRRFTLFPPEQLENLYIGPLELTPSGQMISLVDIENPDFSRYPRYKVAQSFALEADLEPGDALFVPSMWWHGVQSYENLNVLINYWWRPEVCHIEDVQTAMLHALLSVGQLPKKQRNIWKNLFNHYVFDQAQEVGEHIPENARGVLGELDARLLHQMKIRIIQGLKN